MNGKRLIVTLAAMIAVLAGVPVASAMGSSSSNPHGQPTILALTAVGSAFTYQGRLTDSGSPANAVYDFQFLLYDSLAGGTQIGTTQAANDLTVAGGLFTTTLDFGATAFDGNARWLEIQVRPGASTGTYTVLSPRQPVTATPYALWAKAAGGFAVPFTAAGTTATDPLFGLQQTGDGNAIRATRATTGITNPTIFGQNDGSGAGVMGLTTYGGGGGAGVVAGGAGSLAPALQIDNGAIKVSGANPTAFVWEATPASIAGSVGCLTNQCTTIDNPLINGDPNAIIIVTHRYNSGPPASLGVYETKTVGVWYAPASNKWTIFNEDVSTMPAGAKFNVLVIKTQ